MNTVFGENIGIIIDSRDINQSFLAKKVGVSRPTINKTLQISANKEYNIKLETAILIAQGLNVDFPKLFSRLNKEELNSINTYNHDDFLQIFIQNVKRELKGRPQKKLSSIPGIEESTLSQILNGKVPNPNLSSIIYIAEVLDREIEFLFRRGEINDDI